MKQVMAIKTITHLWRTRREFRFLSGCKSFFSTSSIYERKAEPKLKKQSTIAANYAERSCVKPGMKSVAIKRELGTSPLADSKKILSRNLVPVSSCQSLPMELVGHLIMSKFQWRAKNYIPQCPGLQNACCLPL